MIAELLYLLNTWKHHLPPLPPLAVGNVAAAPPLRGLPILVQPTTVADLARVLDVLHHLALQKSLIRFPLHLSQGAEDDLITFFRQLVGYQSFQAAEEHLS